MSTIKDFLAESSKARRNSYIYHSSDVTPMKQKAIDDAVEKNDMPAYRKARRKMDNHAKAMNIIRHGQFKPKN